MFVRRRHRSRHLCRADRAGRRALQSGPRQPRTGAPQGGRQEVRGGRSPASLFRAGAQIDGDGRLRAVPPGQLRRRHQHGQALCDALSDQSGCGLRPVHHRPQLLPADPRRDAGPEGGAPHHRGDGRAGPALARIRICRGRQGQDPLRPRPARRQGDADRPLLSGAARIHRCDQALPQRRRELLQHPPGRGSAVAPDRGLLRDGPRRRSADGRGGARQQLSRQPVVQGLLRAAAERRAGAARERAARGCPRPARSWA